MWTATTILYSFGKSFPRLAYWHIRAVLPVPGGPASIVTSEADPVSRGAAVFFHLSKYRTTYRYIVADRC